MSGVKLGPNQKEMYNKAEDSADDVQESSTRKWLTSAERTQLSTNTSNISTLLTRTHQQTPGDNNSLNTEQHYNSVPTLGSSGITITNPDNSADKFDLPNRDVTALKTYATSISGTGKGNIAVDNYLFITADGTDTLYKIEKASGKIVDSVIPSSFFGYTAKILWDGKIVGFKSSTVYEISPDTMDVSLETFDTGTATSDRAACITPDGVAYAGSTTSTIYKITKSAGVYSASSIVLSEITSVLRIACDSTYYYVFDQGGVVRKYDQATDTQRASTSAFSGTIIFFGFNNGNLCIVTSTTSAILGTDLSEIKNDTISDIGAVDGFYSDGGFFAQMSGLPYTLKYFQLPALTLDAPNFLDLRNTEVILSTESVTDPTGAQILVSGSDIVRTVFNAQLTENRDLTLLKSKTIATLADDPFSVKVTDDFIFIVEDLYGDHIRKYDRKTGILIQSVSQATWWGGKVWIPNIALGTFCYIGDDFIYELDISDLSVAQETIAATGLNGQPAPGNRGAVARKNGEIYSLAITDSDLQISVRGASSYTVTDHALSGLSSGGGFYDIVFDRTDENFFTVDVNGTSVVVRKYNIARALQASSETFTGTYDRILGIVGDDVAVSIDGAIVLLAQSDLSTVYEGSATQSNPGYILDDVLYTASQTTINKYQLPAQTLVSPDFADNRNTEGVNSTPSVTAPDGTPVEVSNSDIVRTVLTTESLNAHRLTPGMRVLDIVASTDTEITNAVPGQVYLLSDTDQVFEKRSDGVHLYTPVNGDTIYNADADQHMILTDDGWRNSYVGHAKSRTVAVTGAPGAPNFESETVLMSDEGNILYIPQYCDYTPGYGQYINIPTAMLSLTGGAFRFTVQSAPPFSGVIRVTINGSTSTYIELDADDSGVFNRTWDVIISNGAVTVPGYGTVTEVSP